MNKEEKSAAIDEIAAQIEGSEAIFAVDYRGISVSQAAELRAKLRENDASFRVVKNRLSKLAADKAGEERLADFLQGPTALTFVRGDTAAAAKVINIFNKEHEVLTFKGGFMEDVTLDEADFNAIARLPSREVLYGQFAGVVASPLTGLVRGLGSMIQGLALQLGQIAEKGLVTGEAPAAEEKPAEEPKAETTEDAPAAPGSEAEDAAVEGEAQPSADDDPSETPSEEADAPDATADPAPETPEADASDTETSEDAESSDDSETSKEEE